jgi:hypothetical protein
MKTIIQLVLLLSTVASTFAQGYVDFHNLSTTRISTEGVLQAATPIGNWYYALLVAPSTQNTVDSTTFAGWTFAAYGTNTGSAGRMSGNTTTDGLGVQIPGFSSTDTADFLVVGWSSNIGTDWNTVRAGWHGVGQNVTWTVVDGSGPGGYNTAYFGWSLVANDIPLAPSTGPFNSVFGLASGGQIPGLNLSLPYVPEPSTLGISSLAAIVFTLNRRRKR